MVIGSPKEKEGLICAPLSKVFSLCELCLCMHKLDVLVCTLNSLILGLM